MLKFKDVGTYIYKNIFISGNQILVKYPVFQMSIYKFILEKCDVCVWFTYEGV